MKKNVACQFPFTFRDKTHNACTDNADPDGRYWCSTKVDRSGKHIATNWGYCSDECLEPEKIACLTTDESASAVKNVPCIFPWNYGDQTYDSCITEDDRDGRLWCATKLDESGSIVDGNWGYCSDECQGKDLSSGQGNLATEKSKWHL